MKRTKQIIEMIHPKITFLLKHSKIYNFLSFSLLQSREKIEDITIHFLIC